MRTIALVALLLALTACASVDRLDGMEDRLTKLEDHQRELMESQAWENLRRNLVRQAGVELPPIQIPSIWIED